MQIVNQFKKSWKEGNIMQFINTIHNETEFQTKITFGETLIDIHKYEQISRCTWYPIFLFKLGYAQALQDAKRSK